MKELLIVAVALLVLAGIALGVGTREMCFNETFKAQFSTIDAEGNVVDTVLLGESYPNGTTIDDVNDIVVFLPEATGVFYLEVSLEPIEGCWEPEKRIFSWNITVNPTKTWETTVVEAVE